MTLETSLLFRLDPDHARALYQTVGPAYIDVIVAPTLRSALRAVTASHKAEALYSSGRETVALEVSQLLISQLKHRGLVVESLLLRDIQLPVALKVAIEAKQQAEQESMRMKFVLQRERQEAERKSIEAVGIKSFQDIVSEGISEKLLAWKGIEATEILAKSQNSKIVIIGSGPNGLPIILGGQP